MKIKNDIELARQEIQLLKEKLKRFEEVEQKEQDEKIRNQNERLSAIIHAIPDLIFVFDSKGICLEFYSSSVKSITLPEDAIVGSSLNDIFDDITATETLEKIKESILQNKTINYEYQIDKNDDPIFFEGRITPLGKDLALIFTRDITESKRSIEKIERLSQAIEQSPVSIIITNLKGNIEYANPKAIESTGYSKSELLGQNPRLLKSGKTTSEEYSELWRTIKQGFNWHGVFHNKRKNGELYWESAQISPIKNKNGKITSFIGIKEDITEKINAEKALVESEHQWKMAMEGAGEGVWDWNILTRELKLSRSWKSNLGYTDEDIQNNIDEWIKLVHLEDKEAALQNRNKHINGETEFYANIHRLRSKSGSYKWFLDRGKVIKFNEKGEPERFVGLHTDITDRIEMEQKMKQLIADKDRFMSILAHDLRSPFNGILGIMDAILSDIRSFTIDELEELLIQMNISALQTYNLLEDLLLWTKSKSGQLVFQPEKINFSDISEEVTSLLKFAAANKKISLFKPETDGFEFVADQNMIMTIVRNLTSNAIKFVNQNGKIAIKAERNPTEVIISVSDNGVGMDKTTQEKLWHPEKPFTSTGTNKEKGTGLGLLLCKEMVEKHGGKIWVESDAGKGSTFSFSIPTKNN